MTDQNKFYIDSAIKLNDFVIKSRNRRIAYRVRTLANKFHRLSEAFRKVGVISIDFAKGTPHNENERFFFKDGLVLRYEQGGVWINKES